jgi:uncharacterized membrane protein
MPGDGRDAVLRISEKEEIIVMKENDNGSLTVFVPSVPTLTAGSLPAVDRERVTMLDAGSIDVTNCISPWGIGPRKILGSSRLSG